MIEFSDVKLQSDKRRKIGEKPLAHNHTGGLRMS